MSLQIVESRAAESSQAIMDQDFALLTAAQPTLHLYSWPTPTASYGLLVKPEEFLYLDKVAGRISLAKRPTGGGILFHLTDLAFSLVLPADQIPDSSLACYALINQKVASLLSRLFGLELYAADENQDGRGRFCMAKPTVYDILWHGGKLVGAAQRRTKKALLHQGTISICAPPWELIDELVHPEIASAMRQTSRFLTTAEHLTEYRELIENGLKGLF